MRKLRELEDVLIRAESALAVVLVLVMLVLAGYNVVYRNVLVPLQQHWAHSGPPQAPAIGAAAGRDAPERDAKPLPTTPPAAAGADDFGGFGGGLDDGDGQGEAESETKAGGDDLGGFGGDLDPEDEADGETHDAGATKPGGDDFGGFGGGLDEHAKPEPETPPTVVRNEPAKTPVDDFGGFGGGLDDEPAPAPEPKASAAADDFGGFGGGLDDGAPEPAPRDGGAEGFGGFGGEAQAADPDALGDDGEDDFGEDDLGDDDQFANLADIDAAGKQDPANALQGGPPPEGSLAARAIVFIDAIKLDWIDIFLRQLVIIVSFLGAMLATQRGKHINIDALSKVLPRAARRVISVVIPLVAVGVCLVFASAGYDLVEIGREYPKELLPWAEEWMLQLMFPLGFGLLALHFGVRVIEAIAAPPEDEPPPKPKAAAAAPVDPREPEASAADEADAAADEEAAHEDDDADAADEAADDEAVDDEADGADADDEAEDEGDDAAGPRGGQG